MSAQWIAVIGTSLCAFALKYIGHSVPESALSNPRIQRINSLIPIVLLTALVAINTLTVKTKIVIDHRIAGIAVAVTALLLKLPFPVIVIGAAAGSAIAYHFGY
jgi:branched-subunit amino acid transport protein